MRPVPSLHLSIHPFNQAGDDIGGHGGVGRKDGPRGGVHSSIGVEGLGELWDRNNGRLMTLVCSRRLGKLAGSIDHPRGNTFRVVGQPRLIPVGTYFRPTLGRLSVWAGCPNLAISSPRAPFGDIARLRRPFRGPFTCSSFPELFVRMCVVFCFCFLLRGKINLLNQCQPLPPPFPLEFRLSDGCAWWRRREGMMESEIAAVALSFWLTAFRTIYLGRGNFELG